MPAGDWPHDVTAAADGSGVWSSGQGAGVAGLLNSEAGAVERIPLRARSAPHGVIVGPDEAAWLTDSGRNAIVRVDTETFASVPLPDPNANVRQIHGRPGEVWGAESGARKLVVVRTRCEEE